MPLTSVSEARAFLVSLFEAAVDRARDTAALVAHLPPPPRGRTIVVGAGKAAASMAQAVERAWPGPLEGLVVTRYGHGVPCARIDVVEAGHPVPDDAGAAAATRILDLARGAGADDLVLCLISGGGSALLASPAPGVTLAQKRSVAKALLASGASIGEMNTVRKHMSAVKGGQLAVAAWPAPIVTLAVSDVPGDAPGVIASGPTVADATTAADARAVLRRHAIDLPVNLVETPDPHDERLTRAVFHLVATPMQALRAAADRARAHGVEAIILGDALEGDAARLGEAHARMAMALRRERRPILLLSGGETTVETHGSGRGGRNTHYLLSMLHTLERGHDIVALAADTDGIDGSDHNAGALIDPTSLARAARQGLNPGRCLQACDSFTFFAGLGDLLVTGPTRTNVNDFRAILCHPLDRGSETAT